MRKSVFFLKRLLFVLALVAGWSFVQAQAPNTQQQKEELAQMSDANYDVWKVAQLSNQEVEPNKVLSTSVTDGLSTYLIQLGYDLENQDAENRLESKISAQPGVISLDADHSTNTVEITIKEEDEHDALRSYFDIQ
jgi:outer membrane lipoprotein-sorting protein